MCVSFSLLHIWFCFPVLPVQLLQFVAWIVQSLIFIPFVFLCSGANFYGCFHGQTSDLKMCHWVTFLLSFWLFFVIDFCFLLGFGNIVNFMKESGFCVINTIMYMNVFFAL